MFWSLSLCALTALVAFVNMLLETTLSKKKYSVFFLSTSLKILSILLQSCKVEDICFLLKSIQSMNNLKIDLSDLKF